MIKRAKLSDECSATSVPIEADECCAFQSTSGSSRVCNNPPLTASVGRAPGVEPLKFVELR